MNIRPLMYRPTWRPSGKYRIVTYLTSKLEYVNISKQELDIIKENNIFQYYEILYFLNAYVGKSNIKFLLDFNIDDILDELEGQTVTITFKDIEYALSPEALDNPLNYKVKRDIKSLVYGQALHGRNVVITDEPDFYKKSYNVPSYIKKFIEAILKKIIDDENGGSEKLLWNEQFQEDNSDEFYSAREAETIYKDGRKVYIEGENTTYKNIYKSNGASLTLSYLNLTVNEKRGLTFKPIRNTFEVTNEYGEVETVEFTNFEISEYKPKTDPFKLLQTLEQATVDIELNHSIPICQDILQMFKTSVCEQYEEGNLKNIEIIKYFAGIVQDHIEYLEGYYESLKMDIEDMDYASESDRDYDLRMLQETFYNTESLCTSFGDIEMLEDFYYQPKKKVENYLD